MADEQKQKFPSEVIDLPSGGKVYGKDSQLYSGKIEVKYMTAKEEDILTSANLIKKGVVIDKLLDSLILSDGVKSSDLLIGDKNAVMVAARILAYGSEYTTNVQNPTTGNTLSHTFDLTKCPFKHFPEDVNPSKNEFSIKLPISKSEIKFQLITGALENIITLEAEAIEKTGTSAQLTTRLRHTIISVDGDTDKAKITNFVNNMLARDSMHLRQEIVRITPDIDLTQEIEIEGETVTVDIPMTVNFFWPTARG